MHVSALLLPLLLSLPTSTVAARVVHGKRQPAHVKAVPDLNKLRREATLQMEAREGIQARSPLSNGQKGKRLVRKKKRSSCVAPSSNSTLTDSSSVGANSTASVSYTADSTSSSTAYDSASSTDYATSSSTGYDASATGASTSTIGGEAWASASASASSSSSEAWTTASTTASSTTSSAAASASASSSSSWYLTDTWSGYSFFDNWSFWSYSDPTHGTVDFQSASDAWNSGLISVTSDRAYMYTDTTQSVSNGRKAIRIHGNKVFTGGLVLMDAYHMPTGCGTWPAWWQNGPNWPTGGEIDILEGINAFTQNQVSLHTAPGCTMPSNVDDTMSAALTTGSFDSYNCGSVATSNQGCGARDAVTPNAFGANFNTNNGGVYAMRWAKVGITVWFFPRNNIPSDITADEPNPDSWGTPMANFPSTDCDPYTFFYDNFNIFDTTFCGDWAGADSVWNYAGYAGQSQSCAAQTGYSTCADYVLNSGSSFSEAYWEIASVKYYNSTTLV